MYLYEGHLGSLFLTNEPLSYGDCYCETCGESDFEIGRVEIAEDVLNLLADDIEVVPGEAGWSMDYVMDLMRENFHVVPTKEAAVKWILAHRAEKPEEEG